MMDREMGGVGVYNEDRRLKGAERDTKFRGVVVSTFATSRWFLISIDYRKMKLFVET